MSDLWGILWLVVLLLGNAFFVGAEFAIISARRSQIEPRAEAGSKAAKTALIAMEHATLMLATSQLGVTVCSLLILNVSEPAIHHLIAIPLHWTALDEAVISVIGFVVTLIIVSYLHVVLGEMVPKNMSFSMPDRAVLLLAPPLVWISRVLKPVIFALNWAANAVVKLFRVEPKEEATSAFTFDEVATIVEQSEREGYLSDPTGALKAAFEFSTKQVGDVMIPLADIVTLPENVTPREVERAVTKFGYSRYILDSPDESPRHYVHLKDLIGATGEKADRPIPAKRKRTLGTVAIDAELEDALALLRRTGAHVARVVTREGDTRGVLFLEDVIEELVGEVHDATRRQ